MKLMHYSDVEVKRILSRKQLAIRRENAPFGKPIGFWLSVDDDPRTSWKGWCESEGFRLGSLAYQHEVQLADDAKVLHLRSAKDLDEFTKLYMDKTAGGANDLMRKSHENFVKDYPWGTTTMPSIMEISWHQVAQKYQGIVISPYIWERRLDGGLMWYYGWDCASGCIWDAAAIKSIKLVHIEEKYKGIVEKTHDELMAELRESVAELSGPIPSMKPLLKEIDKIQKEKSDAKNNE